MWHNVYTKYIKYNPRSQCFIDEHISLLDVSNRRILAVSIRRGNEWGHLVKHAWYASSAKAPVLDEAIVKTKQLLTKWHCEYIFLSIDDNEGLERFIQEFSDKLLYFERRRSFYFINGIPLSIEEVRQKQREAYGTKELTQEDIYDRELKYMTEVHIMSKSTCFYGGKNTTSKMTLIMNGNKYENVLIDEGKI